MQDIQINSRYFMNFNVCFFSGKFSLFYSSFTFTFPTHSKINQYRDIVSNLYESYYCNMLTGDINILLCKVLLK